MNIDSAHRLIGQSPCILLLRPPGSCPEELLSIPRYGRVQNRPLVSLDFYVDGWCYDAFCTIKSREILYKSTKNAYRTWYDIKWRGPASDDGCTARNSSCYHSLPKYKNVCIKTLIYKRSFTFSGQSVPGLRNYSDTSHPTPFTYRRMPRSERTCFLPCGGLISHSITGRKRGKKTLQPRLTTATWPIYLLFV